MDRGGASAKIKLKAVETAGEGADHLLTVSKALFRARLNEAPAGIRRGDGYAIRLTRDEKRAQSNFKVLLASCWLKYFYYETFWTGKNLFFFKLFTNLFNYTMLRLQTI